MDTLAKLVAAFALCICGVAHAGYAQLSPSSVFSASTDGTVMYRAAANDVISGGIARVSAGAALNIGGELVSMPVAVRFAANASKFAVDGFLANPLALGVAGAAWFASQCLAYQGGQFQFTCGANVGQPSTGYQCEVESYGGGAWSSFQATCSAAAALVAASYAIHNIATPATSCSGSVPNETCFAQDGTYQWGMPVSYSIAPCAAGTYQQSDGSCSASAAPVPASPVQVHSSLDNTVLPDSVPHEVPVPLPVLQPILNPDAETDPQPQPLWVPQGNPVPVPNTDPQQYSQPGTRITPQPIPSSPWQVDVAPDDKISTSPTPITAPQAVPADQAASAPSSTQPSDICQLHPNIVACQSLGSVDPQSIPNQTVPLSITADSGWGAGAGSCPAPQTFTAFGNTYALSWQPFCNFASGIRPVVIALAWVSAALVFFGMSRGGHG